MDKHTLRKWIRQQKASHAPSERDAFSHKACLSVMGSPEWRNAHCVLLYHPLPDEVDVRPLIAAATEEGKRVVLPQVVGDDTVLRLYTSEQDLQPGAFGIMEPTGPLFTNYSSIELAIIPFYDSGINNIYFASGILILAKPNLRFCKALEIPCTTNIHSQCIFICAIFRIISG